MERKKVLLLRAALRRGLLKFVNQLVISVRDSFWSQKHIIYYVASTKVGDVASGDGSAIEFGEIRSWRDFPESFRRRLLTESDTLGWGKADWFERGWWIWFGSVNGQIATFCWVYPPGSNDEFFPAMVEKSEFIWQVTTLPEFRGRKLYGKLVAELLRVRTSHGISGFYVSCRDYNLTSRLVLPTVGFKPIGYLVINKWTKRRRWSQSGRHSCLKVVRH